MPVTILTFYHFAPLPDPAALRDAVHAAMTERGVLGTFMLAAEGMNATIAGQAADVECVLALARAVPGFAGMAVKRSMHEVPPFRRRVVKVKDELISLGTPADPARLTGIPVPPEAWNALLARPEMQLIDGRNGYEARMGKFAGAVDLGAADFKDFPVLLAAHLNSDMPVAMYCTGGIRCEKLSSHLLGQGVREVYQLEGGILNYLERIPESESLWKGGCYVFDERVAVGHGMRPSPRVSFCPGCGHPNAEADWSHPLFLPGIRCAHCA